MKNSIFALFLFCCLSSGLLAQAPAPKASDATKVEKPVRIPADGLDNVKMDPKAPAPPKPRKKVQNTSPVAVPGKANTYSRLPKMPEFPGCESLDANTRVTCSKKAMMKYIMKHPNFKSQQSRGVSGTCTFEFIVDQAGAVSEVRIIRALRDDAEFINQTKAIFEEMPKWLPGKLDGNAVNVQMSVPVSFQLR